MKLGSLVFLVPILPIIIAIGLRYIPIQGPRQAFKNLCLLANIMPYVLAGICVMIWQGSDAILGFAIVFFGPMFGIITVPVVAVIGLISWLILRDHDGVELG